MATGEFSVEVVVCDLDGVVYRGAQPCVGAVEGLRRLREQGIALLYLTNNAGHTRQDIVDRLSALGVTASLDDVLTSSWVAAQILAEHRAAGDLSGPVLGVGGPGVLASLREVGIEAMTAADQADNPARLAEVVVQGYGPQLGIADLTEVVYAVSAGATWIATNDDATLPTERGQAPGNGSLVALVAHATGRKPDLVIGKPHPPAYRIVQRLTGAAPEQILAIGDRLDTDIDGAMDAGFRTALVLTGVNSRTDAERRAADRQPDLIVGTLSELPIRGPRSE